MDLRGVRPIGSDQGATSTFDTKLVSLADQIRQRLGPHLAHHLAAMGLYRDLADAQFETNLLVHQPRHDEAHNLPFTAAERLIPFL
jgi:hypothetical protein